MLAPEMLPYNDELITGLLECMGRQREELVRRDSVDVEERSLGNICEMELHRWKYCLTSYIRVRLQKIEKHARFIQSNPLVQRRLSTKELEYLKQYVTMMDTCFGELFLNKLPAPLRNLSETDTGTGLSMVEQPDLDRYVFVRVNADVGPHTLEGGDEADLRKGDVVIIRYRHVQSLLLGGVVQLL